MSSEKTPNLQLHRWQPSDYVLRTEFNDNFAKIDDHAKQVTERLAEIAVNVKSFGAIGDGIADDYQAIKDAVAVINANGGGTLIFPPGTYKIDRYKITGGPNK